MMQGICNIYLQLLVQASWVVSSFQLGILPGCILAAWFIEKLGRKKCLLISALPLTVPWLALTFAKSALTLCVFRFVGGIGFALVITGVSAYSGEIAEKDIRGKLGTTISILKLSGDLFVLSVGPFVSYRVLNLSCVAFPVVFATLFSFMPESPYYLVKVGKRNEAKRNLIRLSSNTSTDKLIEEKLIEIENNVEQEMKNRSTLKELFLKKRNRKPFIILMGIKSFQQLCGVVAIYAYMQTIIESSNSSILPEVSSIISGVIQLPTAFFVATLVDKMGRKPPMIISSLGCAFALTAEGIYFYLLNVAKVDVSGISWLPTSALLLFLVMNPLGLNTLPYILYGELFAINIKGIAIAFITCYASVLAFLVAKFFQPMSAKWGLHVTFWTFAAMCVIAALFCLVMQPETKGKTFAEIQQKLNLKRKHMKIPTVL